MIKKRFLQIIVSNMLISALLLAFFALLGTATVVLVHHYSEDRIAANIKKNLLQNLNHIIAANSYDNDLLEDTLTVPGNPLLGKQEDTIIYRARRQNQPVALAFDMIAPDGYSGKIKLLIAIYKDGRISGVRVIDHKETPGLGDKVEIQRSNWITRFNNKSLSNTGEKQWKVKKDGGIFDQFTGATITPRAVVKAVHKALQYYHKYHEVLFLEQDAYNKAVKQIH